MSSNIKLSSEVTGGEVKKKRNYVRIWLLLPEQWSDFLAR
jgi:hypothetical protein